MLKLFAVHGDVYGENNESGDNQSGENIHGARVVELPDSYPVQAKSVVVLTASIKGCLLLYQKQGWKPVRDRLLQRLLQADSETEIVRNEFRSLIGHAEEMVVASGRRLLIPKYLIDAVRLKDTALWVPQDKYIEIWNHDSFTAWVGAHEDGARLE